MVQIIDAGGSRASRIGAGIGQGLAEQLPKEFSNYRLASGLEKLGQKKDLTPIQQMAELYRSGASSQDIAHLQPLVQAQQQRQAFLEGGNQIAKGAPSPMTAQPQGQTQTAQQVSAQPIEQGKGGLASPRQITEWKKTLNQLPSQGQIDDLARKNIQQGFTQDPDIAKEYAKTELGQNLAAQQTNLTNFEKDFDARMKRDLQGTGLNDYEDVQGEITNALLDQGKYLVGQGATPEEASERIGNIAKELGKVSTQTKTTGAISNWLKPTKEKIRELKDQKKQYEKYGFGETFDDLATAAMGITPMQAAAVLDPLQNAQVKKELDALPSKASNKYVPESKLDSIIKNIKPQDNLLSIARDIRDKHFDVGQFFERISQLEDEGQIALTDQQKRQRQKPASNSMLGDILFRLL